MSNISLAKKENSNFYQVISNLYNFISYKEKEEIRSKKFSFFIITIFFLQILGVMASTGLKSPNDSSYRILIHIFKYTRILPVLSSLDISYLGVIQLAITIIFDLYFLYCTWFLAFSSTKAEYNNFKILT